MRRAGEETGSQEDHEFMRRAQRFEKSMELTKIVVEMESVFPFVVSS